MRFSTAIEHRDFFAKHKYIEFEDLLTQQECALLKTAGETIFSKRLNLTPSQLVHADPVKCFAAGRNVWNEDEQIKRLLFRFRFAEIASALFKTPSLRLGYDQFISTPSPSPLMHPLSLQRMSSFQPITGGLLLQLSHPITPPSSADFCPIPQKVGSGMFLHPELVLALDTLLSVPNQTLLLLVYCPNKARYVLQQTDPLTHLPKKDGYVFGDALKSPANPLIYP